jgi:hypothetical protein
MPSNRVIVSGVPKQPNTIGTPAMGSAVLIVLFVASVPFLLPTRYNLRPTTMGFELSIGLCLLPWIYWLVAATRIYRAAQRAAGSDRKEHTCILLMWVLVILSVAIEFWYGVSVSPGGEPIDFFEYRHPFRSVAAIGAYLGPLYLGGWACFRYATTVSHMIRQRLAGLVAGTLMSLGLFLPMLAGYFPFPEFTWLYEMPSWFIPQAIGYGFSVGALRTLGAFVAKRAAQTTLREASGTADDVSNVETGGHALPLGISLPDKQEDGQ